jgi:hypothetical protein
VLDVGNALEKPKDFLAARDRRQGLLPLRERDTVDGPCLPQGDVIEEAERGDVGSEEAEGRLAVGRQVDQERPHVLLPEDFRGAAEEVGVVGDAPEVVVLGGLAVLPDLEVLDHPLAQGGHGRSFGSAQDF